MLALRNASEIYCRNEQHEWVNCGETFYMDFIYPWTTLLWCQEFWILGFETITIQNKCSLSPITDQEKEIKYVVHVHSNIKWL